MERKPTCTNKQRPRQAYRYTQDRFEARTFTQTASAPTYKTTAKGTNQGQTSYIPYRRTMPPARPDVAQDLPRPQRLRITEEREQEAAPRIHWKRYLIGGAALVCAILMVYTSWIAPWWQSVTDQWHYGDARISSTTITINGVNRDVLGIGYKGMVEIVILPDPTNPQTHASMYILPDPMGDTVSRVVIPHAAYVNCDKYEDIVVEIEGANGVSPVLYGTADGSFQWNTPPKG